MSSLMHPKILGHLRALLLQQDVSRAALMDEFFCSDQFAEFAQRVDQDLLALFQQFSAQTAETTTTATTAINLTSNSAPTEDQTMQKMPHKLHATAGPNIVQPPVARVGQPYQHSLQVSEKVLWLAIDLPKTCGLQIDLQAGAISGVPTQAGQYELRLRYQLVSANFGTTGEIREATLPLLVNADPRSLWKDLPSDRHALFWRADTETAYLQGPALQVLAASKRGRSHAHVGSFRDDAMAFAANQVWQIAAMADGAGSARYSRRAAELICEISVRHLQESLDGQLGQDLILAAKRDDGEQLTQQTQACLAQALRAAWQEIVQTCAQLQHLTPAPSMRDFCSTALLLACCKLESGLLCLSYWVGDGALVALLPDGQVRLLGQADSGEFSGQTRFLDAAMLDGAALQARVQCHVLPQVEALLMMTDGVSDPHFESDLQFQDAAQWHGFWQQLRTALAWSAGQARPADEGAAQNLLAWLDFWASGHHDDRSIAILY